MAGEDLKPHDINVTESPVVGNGGQVQLRRRLTFWVGSHGPFTKEYGPGEGTKERYKLDIQKEIDDLADLHQWAE